MRPAPHACPVCKTEYRTNAGLDACMKTHIARAKKTKPANRPPNYATIRV
jgi:hypothetical protein